MNDVDKLVAEAESDIKNTNTLDGLDEVRVRYLGKKGLLTAQLKSLGRLPETERPAAGRAINEAKSRVSACLKQHRSSLNASDLDDELSKVQVDVSLPGRGSQSGGAHPIPIVMDLISSIFRHAGFDVVYGPEIEDDYHNFEALNIPAHHPARAMHDTFYFDGGALLRTHTSPVQIRIMEERSPPLRIIAPGRVYRCDYDQTHSPMFHQVEGLLIDKSVTMGDLKGLMDAFLTDFFDRKDLKIRYRPSYFPFTEPSMEVDIKLTSVHGISDWLEVMGCGMVHPHVLSEMGIDNEEFNGFAFGLGVERLAMLRHGISDLRLFFENDVQFLKQFV